MNLCPGERFRVRDLVLLVCTASLPGLATAAAPPRIVNGISSSSYPSVVAVLSGADPAAAGLACSGTLIGCRTVLTAAHCVDTDLDPAHYFVFLQHAGRFSVASVALHPQYDFPAADLAVLRLAHEVAGVAPSAINTAAAPAAGTPGTIVGFGDTGGAGVRDFGLKHHGQVRTAPCGGVAGENDATSVCWEFKNPLGAAGSNSNTCAGDSGGPLFLDLGAGPVVAGVTSGGLSSTCLPADSSYDANVYSYGDWVLAAAADDIGRGSCADLPEVGDPRTSVRALQGTLGDAVAEAVHVVRVAPGSVALRIALNATDDGHADFDLLVKSGSPPSAFDADCTALGPGQFGYCEFDAPVPGSWYVRVRRVQGSGAYQLTATTFAAPPTLTPTASPTPSPTPTPPRSPARIDLRSVAGLAGGRACFTAFLAPGEVAVARTDNDVRIAPEAATITDCAVNPAFSGPDGPKRLLERASLGDGGERISVFGAPGVAIPADSLFTCTLAVAADAPAGGAVVENQVTVTDTAGRVASGTGAGTRLRVTGCAGDCNGDGRVSIGEVTRVINHFLFARPVCDPTRPLLDCPAADSNADSEISIGEIATATANLLHRCRAGGSTGPRQRGRRSEAPGARFAD